MAAHIVNPRSPSSNPSWPWLALALLIALPALLPVLTIGAALLAPDLDVVAHLWTHVLPRVTANTAWLLLGVGLGTAVLGTALAALTALCEFPGRRVFSGALLLPLAMPAYVLATAAIGLFDYSGALASSLRAQGIALPEVRSRIGLILVLTLSLYPYVYLLARAAFAGQGARALEAARALGLSPRQAFFRAALPLARPWIAGGVLLALMETLADFGAVAAFNYDTFTTAIYKAWFALFSLEAALLVAATLLLFVLLLAWLEARSRARQRHATPGPGAARMRLGASRYAASAACALVLLAGFAIPLAHLAAQAWRHRAGLDSGFLALAGNAVTLALLAAGLVTAAATLLAAAARRQPGWFTATAVRAATLGYALPGALLAVALYLPLASTIRWLNQDFGLAIAAQGGIGLLLLAYAVRFMAVAHLPVAAGLLRLQPALTESAQLLGVRGLALLRALHWPLLRGSLFTAALLVFVDVMKEMPITLMTRPFGWDTLATRVFELTSEGDYARAALPALGIVAAGLIPVWLLNRGAEHAAPA